MATSRIVQDDPTHRRLRNLVNEAFTARAVATLGDRVQALSQQLLDRLQNEARFDLLEAHAHPIPTVVIAGMMGVASEDAARFESVMKSLRSGLGAAGRLRALV